MSNRTPASRATSLRATSLRAATYRAATVRERAHKQRGQSLIESALVLLIFFALIFAVVDCGQVLLVHQSLVDRVRTAARWGSLHAWDGTGEQIANMILYDQPDEPRQAREGYLGLQRQNVRVTYRPAFPQRPDDELISVAVVDYSYRFLAPWFSKPLVNPRPVSITSAMAYHATAAP